MLLKIGQMEIHMVLSIWISIADPGQAPCQNEILDNIPKLKLHFYDLAKDLYDEINCETIPAPTADHAKQIVDFILANPDKNILVNCQAGISRSGCIAQFCNEYLGYTWPDLVKRFAVPNHHLLKLMVNYFGKPKKTIINDRRRKFD